MTASLALRLAASLAFCAGLALLYLRWRDRRMSRLFVTAGWGLVGLGVLGWACAGHGDVFVSDAVTGVMMAATVAFTGHGLTLAPAKKAAPARAESDNDGMDLGRGYWSRAAARLLGCIIAAPAAGLMAGTLWRAYVPGAEADTIMMMAVLACLVTAAAWVMQLASTRPWRTLAIVSAIAVSAAAIIYLPMEMHA